MKILLALALAGISSYALAVDNGQWGHDPATSEWFKNLHNPSGFPCCDYADGNRIEAPNYRENDDGSYEVFAHDVWKHVVKEKIVTIPNRVGYAVLWWNPNAEDPYCFMPGARS